MRGESNNQVQAFPTAEMFVFVKRGPREVLENPRANLTLKSVVQLVPITDNIGSDSAKSNVTLLSIASILPINRSISEDPKSSVSLLSLLQLLPLNRTVAAENAKSTVSLVSISA